MNARTYSRIIVVALALSGAALIPPAASAQRIFTGGPGFGSHGGFGHRGGRHFFAGAAYAPYLYPDYYDSGPDIIEAEPPQTIVVQSAQPQGSVSQSPAEPLVIELQGDRWVRITERGESLAAGGAVASEQTVPPSSAKSSPTIRKVEATEIQAPLPAALLVFRDGHQEEIGKYVIMGATIYARADYWTSGTWTRKVAIAELDVPATLRANQQRGTQFRLPSSPNEVMMRP